MKYYTVQVNDPPSCYKAGHFPRKFRNKHIAIIAAEEAIKNGTTMARVECPNGGELDFKPNQK